MTGCSLRYWQSTLYLSFEFIFFMATLKYNLHKESIECSLASDKVICNCVWDDSRRHVSRKCLKIQSIMIMKEQCWKVRVIYPTSHVIPSLYTEVVSFLSELKFPVMMTLYQLRQSVSLQKENKKGNVLFSVLGTAYTFSSHLFFFF